MPYSASSVAGCGITTGTTVPSHQRGGMRESGDRQEKPGEPYEPLVMGVKLTTIVLDPEPAIGAAHTHKVANGTTVLGVVLSTGRRGVTVLCREPVLDGLPPMPDKLTSTTIEIARFDEGAVVDNDWEYAGSITRSNNVEHYFWRR